MFGQINIIFRVCCFLSLCFWTGFSEAQSSSSVQPWIHMERQGCYGHCPIYQLNVFPDGAVTYVGEKFILQTGKRNTMIDRKSMDNLKTAIDSSGIFNLKENCCSCFDVTDGPTVKITIREGSRQKSIEHYHGCRSAPKELSELEDKIDELSGAIKWIGTQRERSNQMPANRDTFPRGENKKSENDESH